MFGHDWLKLAAADYPDNEEVELVAPPLRMLAVSAKETVPPKHRRALDRMLLSTEGEADFDSAGTLLRWHEFGWRIERFFHALKQGTRIGDRRLDKGRRLENMRHLRRGRRLSGVDLTWLARNRPAESAPSGTNKLWEGLIILNTSALAIQAFQQARVQTK